MSILCTPGYQFPLTFDLCISLFSDNPHNLTNNVISTCRPVILSFCACTLKLHHKAHLFISIHVAENLKALYKYCVIAIIISHVDGGSVALSISVCLSVCVCPRSDNLYSPATDGNN